MSFDSEELRRELERLRKENAELRGRLGISVNQPTRRYDTKSEQQSLNESSIFSLTADSSSAEKIALFRNLFRGREDVYAVFWTNERSGKKGYSPAVEDPWNSGKGKPKKYLPLADKVIHDHLTGEKVIGCYPLLKDSTCWFLACDFDKEGWVLDSLALLNVCKRFGVPAYLERSRSGRGGHVWIFFSSPVSAILARQLGMRLLRETMDMRGDMDLASYDRFFPNQDFVPGGGFGNLIALPLQKKSRAQRNTEFINYEDPELPPYPDQWTLLSRIERLGPTHLEALLEKIPPVAVGPGTPGVASPLIRHKYPAPDRIRCTLAATVNLEKSGIPPWMFSRSNTSHRSIIPSSTSARNCVFLPSKFLGSSDVTKRTFITSTCREGFWKIFGRQLRRLGARFRLLTNGPYLGNYLLSFWVH